VLVNERRSVVDFVVNHKVKVFLGVVRRHIGKGEFFRHCVSDVGFFVDSTVGCGGERRKCEGCLETTFGSFSRTRSRVVTVLVAEVKVGCGGRGQKCQLYTLSQISRRDQVLSDRQ